jgi:cobalt-zinc-cadmium efflux system protein
LAVEELHVWGLSTSRTALTSHLLIDPVQLARQRIEANDLLSLGRERLAAMGIRKSTLQFEVESHNQP